MMATRPVDFRKGVDGLAALVRDTMGADPFSGTVYVFRAKRAEGTSFRIPFGHGTGLLPVASAVRPMSACGPSHNPRRCGSPTRR
jgi:transposase